MLRRGCYLRHHARPGHRRPPRLLALVEQHRQMRRMMCERAMRDPELVRAAIRRQLAALGWEVA